MNKIDIKSKKIVLFGKEKIKSDFQLFFEDMNVVRHIDELLEDIILPTEFLIICNFDLHMKNYAESKGLVYKKQFLMIEDILKYTDGELSEVKSLDSFLAEGKKIIVLGTGAYFKLLLESYPTIQIEYFVDNDVKKQGKTFQGKMIRPVSFLSNEKSGEFLLIIASGSVLDIKWQLDSMSLEENSDYIFYKKINRLPSALLKQTMIDSAKTNWICPTPYEFILVEVGGDTYNCRCNAWLYWPVGNMMEDGYDKILNSVYARIFRLSLINGTYSFCKKNQCYLLKEYLGNFDPGNNRDYSITLNECQPLLSPVYDVVCNLACKSCRKKFITNTDGIEETLKRIHDNVKQTLLPHVKHLLAAGNGEVFFSKYYRDLIENYQGEKITFLTNGLLFTQKQWDEIKVRFKDIGFMCSVDAATEQTYKLLRGGDFNTLIKNLRFVSELRKTGEITHFVINFVAQNDNYMEIPAFARLGIELGVDEIYYCKILRFGALTVEDMADKDVFSPSHPNHKNLLSVLSDPILNHRCVNIGNLSIVEW